MSIDEYRTPSPNARPDLVVRDKTLAEIRARHAATKKRAVMNGFANILDAQHHLDVVNTQAFKDREFLLETIDRYDATCTDLLGMVG